MNELIKWCTEQGKFISRSECVNKTEDCECHCYEAQGIYNDEGGLLAVTSSSRCYPEEEGPVSYITIRDDELDRLPDLVRALKVEEPHEDIILLIEHSMDYLT